MFELISFESFDTIDGTFCVIRGESSAWTFIARIKFLLYIFSVAYSSSSLSSDKSDLCTSSPSGIVQTPKHCFLRSVWPE